MTFDSELFSALCFACAFIIVLASTESLFKRFNLQPEATRKLGHTTAGILCLLMPLFISSWQIVACLNGSMVLLFVVAHYFDYLPSIFAVGRTGKGVVYFPIAIFLVYVLTADTYALYVSALLVLAVADAAAALAGKRFGSTFYEVEDSTKSLEGSLAFFVCAFLSVFFPLLLLSSLTLEKSFFCATLVALLMTGIEAISLRGSDNLFIPIAVSQALERITTKPLAEVLYQNVSLLIIAIILIRCMQQVPSFNTGGAVTIILFVYGTWSLGSEEWALPVLIAFAVFVFSWSRFRKGTAIERKIPVSVATRVALLPLLILLTANVTGRYDALFGPFLISMSLLVVFFLWRHWALARQRWPNSPLLMFILGVVAALLVGLPPFLWQRSVPLLSLIALALLSGITAILWQHGRELETGSSYQPQWPVANIIYSCAAVIFLLVAQSCAVPNWQPSEVTGVERYEGRL